MKNILNWLKNVIGGKAAEIVLRNLITEANVIKVKNLIFDKLLDPIEDYCKENKFDWAEKPLLIIRKTLNVPDNDQPKTP